MPIYNVGKVKNKRLDEPVGQLLKLCGFLAR